MLKTISREEIFKFSITADLIIADLQAYFSKDFDPEDEDDVYLLEKVYDHRTPFHSEVLPELELKVLAMDAQSKTDYENTIAQKLIQFLREFAIEKVYLVDWLKRNWKDFPFENEDKKAQFLHYYKKAEGFEGLSIPVEELNNVLPLLLFSGRYAEPVAYLFPSGSPIVLFLCDDGNFHISFQADEQERIEKVASQSNFIFGELALCSVYHHKRWE